MIRNWRRIVTTAIALPVAGCLTTLTTTATVGAATASAATASAATAATPAVAATFASALTAVSCPSATDCMAVGWSEADDQSSVYYTLAEAWNGTSWTIVPAPSPANRGGGALLNAISCVSGTDCMAVGDTEIFQAKTGRTVPHPLAEAWNGAKWTLVPTADLGHSGATLNGVACTAGTVGGPTQCMAAGSEGEPKDPTAFTLAESWNGTAWKFVATPAPLTPGGTALNGVSCTGAAGCMAVGYYGYNNGTGTSVSLAESWNGTKWTRLVTPTPDSSATFTGVSCPAAGDCEAVGTDAQTAPKLGAGTFSAVWNGHTWQTQPSPDPSPGAGGAGLAGVSCSAVTACMAAGSWVDMEGEVVSTLAEAWNGQAWAKTRTPSPRYTNPLLGVACASSSDCVAVGSTLGQTGNQVTLGEVWNGTGWELVKTLNP
jgi:hypothetical protein